MEVKQKKVRLKDIKLNPNNPRKFSENDVEKLVNSIIAFPEMLFELRPIVLKGNVVYGGNIRTVALRKIAKMDIEEIAKIIAMHSQDNSEERVRYLIGVWDFFLATKEVNIIDADNLTEQQINEFVIKDNVSNGAWDYDILANEYESGLLQDWGLNVWNPDDTVVANVSKDDFSEAPPPVPNFDIVKPKDAQRILENASVRVCPHCGEEI